MKKRTNTIKYQFGYRVPRTIKEAIKLGYSNIYHWLNNQKEIREIGNYGEIPLSPEDNLFIMACQKDDQITAKYIYDSFEYLNPYPGFKVMGPNTKAIFLEMHLNIDLLKK